MDLFLQNLGFAAGVTLPPFFLVILGWWFRRLNLFDQGFVDGASRLVFTVALPSVMFVNIVQLDIASVVHGSQLFYGVVVTQISFLLVWWGASRWIAQGADRGVFIQAAFRGNLGIIGLALCANLYGSQGLAVGSMLLAVLTLQYNLLSVFILSISVRESARIDWLAILKSILRNPLVIAILMALPLAWLEIRLPAIMLKTGQYFTDLTLPLALLCVGATINLKNLQNSSRLAFQATLLKILILPLFQTLGAWMIGLQGILLGTLFLMFACPTATVTFIMAKAFGGNERLAASIVALSTLLALLTLSTGLFLLRNWQLI